MNQSLGSTRAEQTDKNRALSSETMYSLVYRACPPRTLNCSLINEVYVHFHLYIICMWLLGDGCGRVLVLTTILFLSGITGTVAVLSVSPVFGSSIVLCVYVSVSVMSFFCHVQCWSTDPGALSVLESRDIYLSLEDPMVCEYCLCLKLPRTYHCRFCNKCILNRNHHCPWINNCVGLYTQKHFILFLLYTFIGCSFSIVISITRVCLLGLPRNPELYRRGFEIFLFVFSLIMSLFFAGMTGKLLYRQVIDVVCTSSPIERKLMLSYKKRPFTENFKEVFGSNWVTWAVPVRPRTYPRKVVPSS